MNWEFFKVDNESKRIVGGGWAQNEESARLQKAKEGQSVYILPAGLIDDPLGNPNYEALKNHLCNQVDQLVLANESRMASRHAAKLAEAHAWNPDDTAEQAPYMFAEYEARIALGEETDIQEIRNSILERAEAASDPYVIEGMRVATKAAIRRAGNLPDILAAIQRPSANNI